MDGSWDTTRRREMSQELKEFAEDILKLERTHPDGVGRRANYDLARAYLAQESALRRVATEHGWVTLLNAADRSAPGHHPDMFEEGSWQDEFVKALAVGGSAEEPPE